MIKSHLLNHCIQPLVLAPLAFAMLSGMGFTSGMVNANAGEAEDMSGVITREALDRKNYWWLKDGIASAKEDFSAKAKILNETRAELKKVDVEVYFGTWCGDSHDHLPTFLALADAPKSLKLVALDRKKSHPGYVNTRKIERLPTFIFLRDGKEIGRITETPKKSILEDTLAILKPYAANLYCFAIE